MTAVDDAAPNMLVEALAAHDAGLCVVRVRADGSKVPIGSWKQYQTERPDRETVRRWFADGHPGMGVICGAVSGNLEMFELEGRFVADGGTKLFAKAMREAGLELLLKRLVNGFMVISPSDGRHIYHRVDGDPLGNTKLACIPATAAELAQNPADKVKTLMETRGEGGFVVLAPSHGPVHRTGKPWARRSGSYAAIPTITVEERDALYEVARSFDQRPEPTPPAPVDPTQRVAVSSWARGVVGESWMDAVVDHLASTRDMRGLLEHYGWTYAYTDRRNRVLMTRPGKDDGVSGSINVNERLCPFSTSVPFATGGTRPATYDRLDVIATYEHGGDRQAAARAIAERTGILDAWKRERTPTGHIATTPVPVAPPSVDPETGELVGPSGGPLDEQFWTSRHYLEQIREAARSRLVSPSAVLGAVLARVAAFTPPSTCLPPTIGGIVPLSLFVALYGHSGAGKSSPAAAAADLLPVVPQGCVGPLSLGSGEGLVEAFMVLVEETDDNGKKQKVKRQANRGALFMLDEGQALDEMSSRRGSTILPVLRTAWSGGDPGQANASVETRRSLKAGSYAVGLVSLWQAKAAARLLADADGGTPQRFLWLPTDDPDAPDDLPAWPGPIGWRPPAPITLDGFVSHHPLELHADIKAEIVIARRAELRGKAVVDPLDSHRRLNKLKVAGVFAVLDGRRDINLEDWELAERVQRQSDAIRAWIMAEVRRQQAESFAADAERVVAKEAIVERSAAQRALANAAKAVWRAVNKGDGEPVGRRLVTQAIASRDRQHVTIDDAIAEAERLRWVRRALIDGWIPGEARPA